METLKTIGGIILFIGVWLAGIFLWGSVRSAVFGWRSYSPRKKRKRN